MGAGRARRVACLAAGAVSLLPVAAWLPGGEVPPWYGTLVADWLVAGGATAVLGALVAAGASRAPLRDGVARLVGALRTTLAAPRAGPAVAALGVALSVWASWSCFGGRPLFPDELAALWQARTFEAGALTRPLEGPAPATDLFLRVVHDGRAAMQFPPLWPAVLAVADALGAPWLAGPLAGGAVVLLLVVAVRQAGGTPTEAAGAGLMLAVMPWWVFSSAAWLPHAATAAALLGAVVAAAGTGPAGRHALAAGALLGVAALLRPLDALCWAGPVAWLAWRPGATASTLGRVAAGVAPSLLLLAAWNRATTGDPLTLGYTALWGPLHGLGFHDAPFGPPHTPARALALLSRNALRLHALAFEWPLPALLAPVGALALARQVSRVDRALLAAASLHIVGYALYFHDGYHLGPRFWLPLAPLLARWTAHLPGAMAAAGAGPFVRRWMLATLAVATAFAIAAGVPARAAQYRGLAPELRFDPDAAIAEAGAQGAVVVVRDPWRDGVRARARAFAPASEVEWVLARADLCAVERTLERLEAAGAGPVAGRDTLRALARDSLRVVPWRAAPDGAPSAVRLPDAAYDGPCADALAREGGSTPYALWATARRATVVRELRSAGPAAADGRPRFEAMAHDGRPRVVPRGGS